MAWSFRAPPQRRTRQRVSKWNLHRCFLARRKQQRRVDGVPVHNPASHQIQIPKRLKPTILSISKQNYFKILFIAVGAATVSAEGFSGAWGFRHSPPQNARNHRFHRHHQLLMRELNFAAESSDTIQFLDFFLQSILWPDRRFSIELPTSGILVCKSNQNDSSVLALNGSGSRWTLLVTHE